MPFDVVGSNLVPRRPRASDGLLLSVLAQGGRNSPRSMLSVCKQPSLKSGEDDKGAVDAGTAVVQPERCNGTQAAPPAPNVQVPFRCSPRLQEALAASVASMSPA